MQKELIKQYNIIAPEKVERFIEDNDITSTILNTITPKLIKFFPDAEFSLEVSEDINWTTETKLLVNINVNEEMFFNGMLNHLNDVYRDIEPIIGDIFCPIVLFPGIMHKNFEKMDNYSVINLMARTAYFNNDFDGTVEREIVIRDISYDEKKQEIIEYCKTHDDIRVSDIEAELQIEYCEVLDILDELEKEKYD